MRVAYIFCSNSLLRKADCLVRTNISTSTTLCTHIRVNRILFTFRNCSRWALINTCTTSDTVITNYVSHNKLNYNINNVFVICTSGFKAKKYIAKIHIKIEIPTFRYAFLNYLYFISIKDYTIRIRIIR